MTKIDNRKRALVMALVDPSGNPCPKRAISLLQNKNFEVHVASFAFQNHLSVDAHYQIPTVDMRFHLRLLRKIVSISTSVLPFRFIQIWQENLRWQLKNLENKLSLQHFDVILVEDLYLLPLAVRVKKNAKIIFDAREYYPRQYEQNLLWRMTERFQCIRLCRQYFPHCDGFMTVSQGLADEYKKEFFVHPHLVRSTPYFQEMPVKAVDEKNIRIVHHGVANKNRRIENMIDIANGLDERFVTDFYLVGNLPYVAALKQRAAGNPRIRFFDPVPFDKIISMLNHYDIGLSFLEPTTFNLKYCLPNKLFEFIQARLMVATGPSPDMAEIVSAHHIGIVSDQFDPREMASKINRLTATDIYNFRLNSAIAAQELSFEREGQKFIDLVMSLVK